MFNDIALWLPLIFVALAMQAIDHQLVAIIGQGYAFEQLKC